MFFVFYLELHCWEIKGSRQRCNLGVFLKFVIITKNILINTKNVLK